MDYEKYAEVLAKRREELETDWKVECQKYEQLIPAPSQEGQEGSSRRMVARRNYFNPDGVVQDKSLYPYDDKYYALLDAYDCLYNGNDQQHPISSTALRPKKDLEPGERALGCRIKEYVSLSDDVPYQYLGQSYITRPYFVPPGAFREQNYPDALYTGPESVQGCILLEDAVEMRPSASWKPNDTLHSLFDGQDEFWKQIRQAYLDGKSLEQANVNLPPSDCQSQAEQNRVLLRLLRHALSEYQQDYYLALSILTRLCRDRALENPSVLRDFLLVIDSEFIECGNSCEIQGVDHHCGEWAAFLNGLHLALGLGIDRMTNEHVNVIGSFVWSCYLREFGHLMTQSEPRMKQRQTRLKRMVVALRTEDQPNGLHIHLMEILVCCLGTRGNLERSRCRRMAQDTSPEGASCLASYWNIVAALVAIGHASLRILPDTEAYSVIASEIVKNLAYCFMDGIDISSNRARDIDGDEIFNGEDVYSTYLMKFQTDAYPNVISYDRYLERMLRRRGAGCDSIESSPICTALDRERPDEVLQIVRNLFVRDMVDIRFSRMGYGDFVVWCGYDLNIYDPVMHWHEYQFPVEEEEESDEESEEEPFDPWVKDKNGAFLDPAELKARYNFSLLTALHAWRAPWSPMRHSLCSRQFRSATKEFILCSRSLNLPNEIMLRVMSFLDHRWWPDDRRSCWSYSCQLNNTLVLQNKERTASGRLFPCEGCHLAWYCSAKCQKDDLKAGHRRLCCSPPLKARPREEVALFRTVFNQEIPPELVVDGQELNAEKDDTDGDDSWESWETDDDNNETAIDQNEAPECATEAIVSFFMPC